jgi:putative flippase GtrA
MVGAIGILVQEAALCLMSAASTNYLIATVVAVESAILHNFVWHRFFTWPDRRGSLSETFAALVRFNLSNGLISLVGNLALMALFSGALHWPLLPANLISITICAMRPDPFVVCLCIHASLGIAFKRVSISMTCFR